MPIINPNGLTLLNVQRSCPRQGSILVLYGVPSSPLDSTGFNTFVASTVDLYWHTLVINCGFTPEHPNMLLQYQQKVNWFGRHMWPSQTVRLISPVILSNSRFCKAPLEVSKELSDAARKLSDAPQNTCNYGGVFKMLRYVTLRIGIIWHNWDLCGGLEKTSVSNRSG